MMRATGVESSNTRGVAAPAIRRRQALMSAGAIALVSALTAGPALAQSGSDKSPSPSGGGDATVSEIVVTGTRIQTTGFTAPTPTSVIGEEQIQNNAQPNVFATIVQLPSLQDRKSVV